MKLNIACGTNVSPGFINIDISDVEGDYLKHLRGSGSYDAWPEHQRRLIRWIQEGRIAFVRRDLRDGFPDIADGTVEAIYVGQAIEHLSPVHEVPKFLKECARMLRKGGLIKLTTPNLTRLLRAHREGTLGEFAADQPAFYAEASPDDQLAYLMFGAAGENCKQESYEGHFHCYTFDTLRARLEVAGFTIPFGQLVDVSVFDECMDMGMSHSFFIIGVK
jgi:SAM-dependent methyltransferase